MVFSYPSLVQLSKGETGLWTRRVSLGLLVLIANAGVASACRLQAGVFSLGQDSDLYLEAEKGETCQDTLSFYRSLSNGSRVVPASISSIVIISKASHGIAGTNGLSYFAYQPAPGFTGRDKFVMRVGGERSGELVASRVTVYITVR